MDIDLHELRTLVADKLAAALPGARIGVEGPLLLSVQHPDGAVHPVDLSELWQAVQGPAGPSLAELEPQLNAFAAALSPAPATGVDGDGKRLVIMIKPRSWVEQAAAQLGRIATAPIAGELMAVFAFDTPDSVIYEITEALPEGAMAHALENVLDLVEGPEILGDDPFLIQAGGTYEASLLLADFWDDLADQVQGDLVVAVPTRDLLMVSGTADADRYARLVQLVAEALAGSPRYPLSAQILRWEARTWVLHDTVPVPEAPPGA